MMEEQIMVAIGSKKKRMARLAAVGAAAMAAAMIWTSGTAEAQSTISSTGDLKRACETSANNTVNANSDMKINSGAAHSGAYAPTYEQVTTGCTVKLASGAKFETDGVAMSFDGPFKVESAGKGSAIFTKSAWKAASMIYDLPGADSDFKTDASRLDATTGNIDVKLGNDAELQFQYMTGVVYALKAAGDVNISGGDKTFFNVFQASPTASKKMNIDMKGRDATLKLAGRPSIAGAQSLNVDLGGGTPSLSAEDTNFGGGSDGVVISSPADKALAEIKPSAVFSRGDVQVRMLGSETALKSTLTRFQSDGGRVDLLAGGPGSSVGTIELSNSDVYSTTGTSVQGSPEGNKGIVKVGSGSTLRGGSGGVVFKTGAMGTTEVKEAGIWSSTIIRALTGQGGTCIAEKNSYISPAKEICQ